MHFSNTQLTQAVRRRPYNVLTQELNRAVICTLVESWLFIKTLLNLMLLTCLMLVKMQVAGLRVDGDLVRGRQLSTVCIQPQLVLYRPLTMCFISSSHDADFIYGTMRYVSPAYFIISLLTVIGGKSAALVIQRLTQVL